MILAAFIHQEELELGVRLSNQVIVEPLGAENCCHKTNKSTFLHGFGYGLPNYICELREIGKGLIKKGTPNILIFRLQCTLVTFREQAF